MNKVLEDINTRLEQLVDQYNVSSNLHDSMKYSLSAGGKRIRPQIVLLMVLDRNPEMYLSAIDAACALEFVHTYSLIHDDLPAMDNSMYRRGRLTNHQVYGEDVAILAGDGLLTESFQILASCNLNDATKIKCVQALSKLAGANGMVAGQTLDIDNHTIKTFDELSTINYHKTHDLLLCAFLFGAYILNLSNDEIEKIKLLAMYFGLSFQIKDDIDDITKSSIELGKDANNDEKNNKMTYPKVFGLEKSYELLNNYQNKVLDLVKDLFGEKEVYKLIKRYYD